MNKIVNGVAHRTATAQNCISIFGSSNISSGSIDLFGVKYA